MWMEIKGDIKHYSRGSGFSNCQMVVPLTEVDIMMKQWVDSKLGKIFGSKHIRGDFMTSKKND